jgi:hypothetical protein
MPTEKRLEWEQLLSAGAKSRETLPSHLLRLLDTLDEKLTAPKDKRPTVEDDPHGSELNGPVGKTVNPRRLPPSSSGSSRPLRDPGRSR